MMNTDAARENVEIRRHFVVTVLGLNGFMMLVSLQKNLCVGGTPEPWYNENTIHDVKNIKPLTITNVTVFIIIPVS